MFVYQPGEPQPGRRQTMFLCPAADIEGQPNAEWVDEKKQPLNFTVEFVAGRAEVPDHIGRYMIARGLAQRTRLLVPTRRSA